MPTYEYECLECGNSFELFQQMTEKRLKKCAKCGGKVKRLIGGGGGIIFKGSGFYANDYKKSSPQEKSKMKSEDKKEGKRESEDKKEGKEKSAAKSEKSGDSKKKS